MHLDMLSIPKTNRKNGLRPSSLASPWASVSPGPGTCPSPGSVVQRPILLLGMADDAAVVEMAQDAL